MEMHLMKGKVATSHQLQPDEGNTEEQISKSCDTAGQAENTTKQKAEQDGNKEHLKQKKKARKSKKEKMHNETQQEQIDTKMSGVDKHTDEDLRDCKTTAIEFLNSQASRMTSDDQRPMLLQESLDWELVSGTQVPFPSPGNRYTRQQEEN
jgi:hypothetical protein